MSVQNEVPTYVLGESEIEQKRLIFQAGIYKDLTREVFEQAGIGPGMRVLDLGCGAGDVSLLVASLVGPTGTVIGADRSKESLDWARRRVAEAGLRNVSFVESDILELTLDEPVDAVVGRLILLYLADPVSAIRKFKTHLRPGGVLAFHEMDMTGARCVPAVPLFEQSANWIRETFRRGGVERDMGSHLYSTFLKAGFSEPKLLLRARVEGGEDSVVYEYITNTLRSLMPYSESLGVTTREEADLDTLVDRLRDATVAAGAAVLFPPLIGAWARVPSNGSSPV